MDIFSHLATARLAVSPCFQSLTQFLGMMLIEISENKGILEFVYRLVSTHLMQ